MHCKVPERHFGPAFTVGDEQVKSVEETTRGAACEGEVAALFINTSAWTIITLQIKLIRRLPNNS